MAYVSKEHKTEVANKINPLLKEYGLKGTLSVNNKIELVLTIWSGEVDFIGDFQYESDAGSIQVNEYHLDTTFSGKSLEVLKKLVAAMYVKGWKCDDDIMSDYFYRTYFISVKIGRWNKPYQYTPKSIPQKVKIIMSEYANHTIDQIVVEINTLQGMVDQMSNLNPQIFDLSKMIENISAIATSIGNELTERSKIYSPSV